MLYPGRFHIWQPQDAARSAASDVRGELSELTERSETAAGKAEKSETDAAEHRRLAEEAAKFASEVVSDGVADATSQIKGKLRLGGDLGGTADEPTVPGLADKADEGHGHEITDVDGLEDIADAVRGATPSSTGDTLVKRREDGTVSVGTPTDLNHAANRRYVDSLGTATALPSSVVRRDGNGRVSAADPEADTHVTTKHYVDSRIVVVDSEDDVGDEPGVLYVVAE